MIDLTLGNMQISVLPEIRHQYFPTEFLFKDLTAADAQRNADWLGPEFIRPDTLQLGLAFQSFIIRRNGLNILVDSCNGNEKQRPTAQWQHDLRSGEFMKNLAGLGLSPEDIHIVLCTHLHCDHVGWNTRLENGRWVPTFPNARYIFNRTEFDHYAALNAAPGTGPANHGSFDDSVLPVVRAGLADFVDDGFHAVRELEERVYLEPSPGHSPGHVCIRLDAATDSAIIVGDAIHHPVQLDMPHMVMRADTDPAAAAETRRRLMTECADSGAWLMAGHFPHIPVGRVRPHGDVFRLTPAG